MRLLRSLHAGPLSPGSEIVLEAGESRHLARVLRARAGDPVYLLDGRGTECRGRMIDPAPSAATVAVEEVSRHEPEPPRSPALALALTRTGDFEETLERAIELGCAAFHPVESDRTVVRLDERKRAARRERWERLAAASLKQCERLWLPRIEEPAPLAEVLERLAAEQTLALALVERSGDEAVQPLDALDRAQGRAVCFLCGPEGGWSPEEREALRAHGAVAVTFGPAVLRSGTAALAALSSSLAHRLSRREIRP